MRELFPGDVIQIKPAENMLPRDGKPVARCFQGCFAMIEEVNPWGVIANIYAPQIGVSKDIPLGVTPLRLMPEQFVYIGVSVYPMGTRDDV